MKPISKLRRWLPSVLAGLVVVASSVCALGALPGDRILVNAFNTTNEVTAYFHEYGDAAFANVFSTNDANGATNSGSMLVEEAYGTGHPQGAYRYNLSGPIGFANTITNLQFDIKVDPSSALDQYGSASYFQLAIRDQGGAYVGIFGGNVGIVATNNGWRHISFGNTNGILPATVTNITAIMIDPYDGNYTNVQSTNSLTKMYIDNIKFAMPYPSDTIVIISTFDNCTNDVINSYHLDYGNAGLSPGGLGNTNGTQCSTDDANGDPNSGSMLILEAYGAGAPNGSYRWDTGAAYPFVPLTNANTFTNLEFDIKVDPMSALDPGSNACYFQFAIRDQGYNYVQLFAGNIAIVATNNGWRHISVGNGGQPLVPLAPVTLLQAIQLDPYDGNYTNTQDTNVLTQMYIDNIIFRKPQASVVIPPPKVSIEKASTGLNLIAGGTGINDRENIRTLLNSSDGGNSWSWVGNGSTPVTYSFTITEYPTINGFQMHLFLVPGSPSENAPDYNEPSVVMMDLQKQAGGGQWTFRFKTNQPSGNTQLYGPGARAQLTDPGGVPGTWQLRFVNDTNVTMTSPRNVTTNFTISPDIAAAFADPISIFYGVQPNSSAGVGLKAVISDVKVQGITANPLYEDNFASDTNYPTAGSSSTLDTVNQWLIAAVNPAGVLGLQPSDYPFWVNWTLPASGFALQTNALVKGGVWSTNALPAPATIGGIQRTLLSTNNLPGNNIGYFRLADPGF